MAVGSAFDANVKSVLHKQLVGDNDPRFEFTTLFEAQVETHCRDKALIAGKEVYDAYVAHGALADLVADLEGCVGAPKFESSIQGNVERIGGSFGAVPILGKPDIFFITKNGARVIFDWKVNGYYSKASPKPGYVRCLPERDRHADCMVMQHQGYNINVQRPLNTVDSEWADQTASYAWLLGEEVGSKFIVAIDQIACNSNKNHKFRIAQHRSHVSEAHQIDLFERYHKAWYAIQNDHIFDGMTKEESIAKCKTLELVYEARKAPQTGPYAIKDFL